MSGEKPDGNSGDDGGGGSSSLITLLVVIVAVGLLYWLSTVFFDWNKTQACIGYGGRNCAPRIPLNNQ